MLRSRRSGDQLLSGPHRSDLTARRRGVGLLAGLAVLAGCTGTARIQQSSPASDVSGPPTTSTVRSAPLSTSLSPAPRVATRLPTTASPTGPVKATWQPVAAGTPPAPPAPTPHAATGTGAPSPGLPGMPAVADRHNVYASAGAGMVTAAQRGYPAYAYVPHNKSGDVWVIDQRTHAVIRKCRVGGELQHVVPSYNMTQLYATDDVGNRIRVIDPRRGQCGRVITVRDPYNLYFTPDGRYAVSVAEELRQLIWYDPVTWTISDITSVPQCAGIDHADFSADGRTAVFTCEFSGRVAVIDVAAHKLLRTVAMPVVNTVMGPQDIKLAPDGSVYYIADSDSNGVWVLDGAATRVLRHIDTGRGAHGLYLSRDAARLFVTNRLDGSISVLDAYTGRVETKWVIPGGGSPDMGNVTADGKQLWVSGRYNNVVYVLDTSRGRLLATIPVGDGPHGLALMPLPGRYSIGHTGITR